MTDRARELAEDQGLGPVEAMIGLDATRESPGGKRASSVLCLCERGLLVVTTKRGVREELLDVLDGRPLSYTRGRLRDQLTIGGARFGVPRRARAAAERALALARLRRGGQPERAASLAGWRYVDELGIVAETWLVSTLETDEVVLAWLSTGTTRLVPSSLGDASSGALLVLLTDRRALTVALSPVGDARVESLPEVPLRVDERSVRAGNACFTADRSTAARLGELAPLFALTPCDRLRELARLEYEHRRKRAALEAARRLLALAAKRGDLRSEVAAYLLAVERSEPPAELPHSLAGLEANALATLFEHWRVSARAGRVLESALEDRGDAGEPWALELHVAVHAAARREGGDPLELARGDLALAKHLLDRGAPSRARPILERCLTELPSEALDDLLPPRDADLTEGAGGQALRIRLYELLARARPGDGGRPDPMAAAELARLQPLVVSRTRVLIGVAEPGLRARAVEVARVLEVGGLGPCPGGAPQTDVRPLPEAMISGLLEHPLVREGGALLGRLQALLAEVPRPDTSAIRDYCEQLSVERHGDFARVLADAALMLGVPRLEAYVSRGDKSVGLRAYDGDPPFVLVGGRHLEPGELAMTPRELAFAIGAEAAHLRFGHSRATSSEVWAGAVEKARQGLDVALGIMPAWKGVKLAQRARGVMTALRGAPAGRSLAGALAPKLAPRAATLRQELLGPINEELVAAHRVMQLTADRAGLVLCGELGAAVRAMLLVRRDHHAELVRAERVGIAPVLARRSPGGAIALQDLAIRVAALVAFYLSDDFARLYGSAHGA
ncbi:MAG: hypothetical protein OZ921_07835 [Sorangiineae bacterium]|nr:hypothetical protein [Polyangiaceae bacterium]MEB2322407.1 hypothetical protein [Sorangiineae bacterium]